MDTSKNREYHTEAIAVSWEPALCIHAANCIRSQPGVFNPLDRPWVHIDAATADEIATAVSGCPTGALHYRRLDGGPAEIPADPPVVRMVPNGPLYLSGQLRIEDQDGGLIREDTRLALCRCGQSQNRPFCDNSHRLADFRAAASGSAPAEG